MYPTGYTVCLFANTEQGNHALGDLLESGVAQEAILVIGDIGPAAGTPGAQRHVTFDVLHLAAADRTLVMDHIREGGGVVATDASIVDPAYATEIGERHRMVRVFHTTPSGVNPSHNAAL